MTAIALLCVDSGFAADWRISKGLSAGVLYSDNADTLDGVDAGDTTLILSPYARLGISGNRSELALNAQFDLKRHTEDDRTEFKPQLVATSRTVLVERFANFDARARVSQQSVETIQLIDDAGSSDETAETYEFSLSPKISDTFSDRGRYEASYRFAATRGSDDALEGSDQHGVGASFVVSPGATPFSLLGGTNYELSKFESNDTARSASVEAGLGYTFRPALGAFVGVGYDHVRVDGIEEDASGMTWSTGLRWRPNRRLEANVGYAKRSFGSQPNASIIVSGRRSSIELSWVREANYADSRRVIDLADLPGVAPVSQPVRETSGSNLPDTSAIAEIDDDALGDTAMFSPLVRDAETVDERVKLTYSLRGRRTVLTAGLEWAERVREDSQVTSEARLYSLSATRRLSARADVLVRWTKLESRTSDERSVNRENRYEVAIRVAL